MRLLKSFVRFASFTLLVPVMFPAALLFSRAGEAASRILPGRTAIRVSVRSFSDFVSGLDEFVQAVSKGTPTPIGPGWVSYFFDFQFPIPKAAFLPSEEMQLLCGSFPVNDDNVCLILRVKSFSGFIQGMRGAIIGGSLNEEGEGSASFSLAGGPGGGGVVHARDVGGGRVALAADPDIFERLLDREAGGAFSPVSHEFDGLASIAVSPERLGWLARIPFGRFDRLGEKEISTLVGVFRLYLQGELPPGVFKKGALEQLLSAYLEKALPPLSDLVRSRSIRLDLDFDASRIRLALGLESPAGGPLDLAASAMVGRGRAANPLSSRIGDDAMALSVAAPLGDVFPGLRSAYAAFVWEAPGKVFPDLRDRLEKSSVAMADLIGKGKVEAVYCDPGAADGREVTGFSLMPVADPLAALDAAAESADLINDIADRLFEPEYQGIRMRIDRDGDASSPRLGLGLEVVPDSGMARLLDESGPGGARFLEAVRESAFSAFMVGNVVDGALLGVGAADLGDLSRIAGLASADRGGRTFLASPAAVEALKDLRHAQLVFMLLDAESGFRALKIFVDRIIARAPGLPPSPRLPSIDAGADGVRHIIGYGLGADAFGLIGELRLPVPALTAIVNTAYTALNGDGEDGDGGEYEEDGDEEEEDGEGDGDA